MGIIIKADQLCKKYIIRHQQKDRYGSIKDLLTEQSRKLVSAPSRMIGKPLRNDGKKEEFWALQDVSFEVQQGDRIGVIGRNGAGKSTLLKILSRITEPTTGRVTINGRIASLLEVGTGFHPELSGRENIFLNGAILGMRKHEIKRKFDEIVDFSGVERFLDTPVKRYSSGMYVRLAFAVAAHLESEILVVDEVLAVGDADFQKKCLGKMQDVSTQDGRTVLFVSHNMAAISRLCNKAILLNNGKKVIESGIHEVIETYISMSHQKDFYETTDNDANKDLYFRHVFLSKDRNVGTNTFSVNDSIYCVFNLGGTRIVEDATLTFIIRDKDLHPIFSDHYLLTNSIGKLTAKLPREILLPGKYYLQFMMHIPNKVFLDNIEDFLSFSIEETGSKNAIYNADLGYVNVQIEWEQD